MHRKARLHDEGKQRNHRRGKVSHANFDDYKVAMADHDEISDGDSQAQLSITCTEMIQAKCFKSVRRKRPRSY
jgi:hypothetical protein